MKKLLVVLLVLGLATPAMAASQWYWWGTARVLTGWVDNSKELPGQSSFPYDGGEPSLDGSIKASGSETGVSDSGVLLNIADSTQFGAKIVASDAVSGAVVLSTYQIPAVIDLGGEQLSIDGLIVRVLYGDWKFGNGSLRVGQDYTPASFLLYSNEIGDLGWGSDEIMTVHSIPYISRRPQLKLTFGGFQLAFIQHNTTVDYSIIRTVTNPTNPIDDEDFNLPRIEAAYQWNINPMISLRPILGYQTYDASQITGDTEDSKSITSYVYGLGCNLRLGAAYVNLAIAGATNPGNYGLFQPNATGTRYASTNASGDIEDASSLSGMAVVGFKVNPTVKLEAGFGYLKTEGKSMLYAALPKFAAAGGAAYQKLEQTSLNYYVQAQFTLAPGVYLTPEIGTLDMGDLEAKDINTKIKQGSSTWFAAQFRVDF